MIFLLLKVNAVGAQDSLVGGMLTQDAIWTKDYTYIVYKDLLVPENITLIIKPGVLVKVNQGRGIYIYGGNLSVNGREDEVIDSVSFIANHTERSQLWKWKGISFTGSGYENGNHFFFVNIVDAEIAIDIYNSDEVIINNSSMIDNQNKGIRIFNSKNCQIVNCLFKNNYDGIELVASDASETSGNDIQNCIFANLNHNIYLQNAFGGMFFNNIIEGNIINGGNNGVWADNGGGIAFGKNVISKNIFLNIGYNAGYGLLIAEDSIEVSNNIFWKNRIAIYYDPNTVGSIVKNSSFYQNEESIILSSGVDNHTFEYNTFSENNISVFKNFEAQSLHFNNSNIFNYSGKKNIIVNENISEVDFAYNFWNTANIELIQEMIWDQQDNPQLGAVNIIPHLQVADTISPISPPSNPIKQLVNGEVKLSWRQNPEDDLQAYAVYFGVFKDYTFSNSMRSINDTVFYLAAATISDTIAITAYDKVLYTFDSQVLGHESPFSFAGIYPYSGPDNTICKTQVGFQIENSTIPYEYKSLEWLSNGDGVFENPDSLNPFYYLGTDDILNGEVVLTLHVLSDGKELSDSMTLSIKDDPYAFAGYDTIIFSDSQLELTDASLSNHLSHQWLSTGDGSFDNDTILHAVYSPGLADIAAGEVDLVLLAQSECGMTTDTIKLFLEPYFSLDGNLWYKNQKMQGGVIIAINENEKGTRSTDITHSGSDGFFRFAKLMGGKYLIYAVPDPMQTNGAVPGYYANTHKWQNAFNISLEANTYDVDIQLPSVDYQLPEGEGSISGHFELPALNLFNTDIYCNAWFDPKSQSDYCSGGLSNITVLLYNSDGTILLDFTLSDENGDFYFNNLPYGNYILDAENAGYQTMVSSLIKLSPQHKHETGVILQINADKIGIYRTDNYFATSFVDVYPNPASSFLNILLGENVSVARVSIYNSMGQLAMQKELSTDNSMRQTIAKLNVSELTQGLYFGTINFNSVYSNFIFVKK